MDYRLEYEDMSKYLSADRTVDFDSPIIREKAKELFGGGMDEIETVKTAFEFVRDEIAHSWDIQSERVTRTASEALRCREGICYSKSMLLAALLRSQGIPAGFCYQRLTLGDTPDTGYCVHSLNAVYLSKLNKWMRLDARGNTNGRNAQFSPDHEQLAFPVRAEYDETDYPTIYAAPVDIVTRTLESNTNAVDMVKYNLPTRL